MKRTKYESGYTEPHIKNKGFVIHQGEIQPFRSYAHLNSMRYNELSREVERLDPNKKYLFFHAKDL